MKLKVLKNLPETNSKGTPLLFVHGAFHGAWCWKVNFLPYFSSKGFSSYALSLRGHGESEGRENLHSFSLSDYTDDVLEAMRLLKEKPVLIGHSMGGALVQKILHLHPEKIKAAVLISSVSPNGMLQDVLRTMLTNFRDVIQMLLFNRRKVAKFPAHLYLSKKLSAGTRDDFLKLLQPESKRAMAEVLKQIVPGPITANVPMLVLGSRKDVSISARTALSIGKIYKTKPVIFTDMSHDMMLDPHWETVADQILSFLYGTISANG